MEIKKTERAKAAAIAWLKKPMTNALKRNVEDATALMFYLRKTTASKEKKITRSFKDLLPNLQWVSEKWKDIEAADLNTGTQHATKTMSSHFQNIRKNEKQMKELMEVNEGRFSPEFGKHTIKLKPEELDPLSVNPSKGYMNS